MRLQIPIQPQVIIYSLSLTKYKKTKQKLCYIILPRRLWHLTLDRLVHRQSSSVNIRQLQEKTKEIHSTKCLGSVLFSSGKWTFLHLLLPINNLHNLKEILQNHRKTLLKIPIVELKTLPALHNYLRPGETLVFINFLEKTKGQANTI